MKKFLKISGIILGVILLLMIILPFLFKDKIIQIVKEEANKSLTAELNFEDAGLNLFSRFPNLSLSIDNMTIVNRAPFEGDTLMRLSSFNASIDLFSLFGDQIKIKGITLKEPSIFVYVLQDSTANYNIFVEDTTTAAAEEETSDLNLELSRYTIENGDIAYLDQTSDIFMVIKNINHTGNGDFTRDNFTLTTETTIEEFSLEKSGINYLNKVNTALDLNLDIDMAAKRFAFKKNELKLNNLYLNFYGWVSQSEDLISMDIKFSSPQSDFKDIISLIPAIYTEDFNDLKSSGNMSINGFIKGEYQEENLPSFSIEVSAQNGMFQYPKLPTAVNNVNLNMSVINPGGSADNTVINVSNFHMELGSDPFDAVLLLRNPVTAPYIETKMKGRIDLGGLKNAIEMEGVNKLEGIINADFEAKGTLASRDIKALEKISASGKISASNIFYSSDQLADEINIPTADLTLTPQNFNLSNFNMKMGKNDLSASGNLTNVLSYLLSDAVLNGTLNISSNYFDINPYLTDSENGEPGDSAEIKAVTLPERINFSMNSNFNTLLYDNLTLQNVKGTIVMADQRLTLRSLNMNLLGGSLTADGYYQAPAGINPSVVFNLNIRDFEIKNTYESFVTVQRFAPMAKYMGGKFSSILSMNTTLDESMQPVWDSFNSSGSLNIRNAAISGFKPLEMVGDKLNIESLKDPRLDNVTTSFTIKNGRFYISPFTFNVLNQEVSFAGSNGIDQSIDYLLAVKIPVSNLKQQANTAISNVLKKDINLITANNVEVKANITGSIESPQVSVSAGDIAQDVQQQITDQIKEEVQSQIDEKKEELKKEAEQQIDTLKNKLKKEAEDKLKDLFKRKR
jgi:uncharacterized protein involved in outer membrane biogenesis